MATRRAAWLAVMATGGRRGTGLGATTTAMRRASGARGERRDSGIEATTARAARQWGGDDDGATAVARGSERRWDATVTARGGTGRETKGAWGRDVDSDGDSDDGRGEAERRAVRVARGGDGTRAAMGRRGATAMATAV
jgi:hypothetical protein